MYIYIKFENHFIIIKLYINNFYIIVNYFVIIQ